MVVSAVLANPNEKGPWPTQNIWPHQPPHQLPQLRCPPLVSPHHSVMPCNIIMCPESLLHLPRTQPFHRWLMLTIAYVQLLSAESKNLLIHKTEGM